MTAGPTCLVLNLRSHAPLSTSKQLTDVLYSQAL